MSYRRPWSLAADERQHHLFEKGGGSLCKNHASAVVWSIVCRTCVLDIIPAISSIGMKNQVSWRILEIGCNFRRAVAIITASFYLRGALPYRSAMASQAHGWSVSVDGMSALACLLPGGCINVSARPAQRGAVVCADRPDGRQVAADRHLKRCKSVRADLLCHYRFPRALVAVDESKIIPAPVPRVSRSCQLCHI